MESDSVREASHAGSWYSKNSIFLGYNYLQSFYKENELDRQISSWLDYAKLDIKYIQGIKAIIGPYSIFFHI